MDQERFDALTRVMASMPTRRRLLRGLSGAGLGIELVRLPDDAVAKRKGKRKKGSKPPKPNAFGCLDVGAACKNADQCCPGICQGKKGRRKCKAHDTGGCVAGAQLEFCGGAQVACTTSLGMTGACATTTGNAGYCLLDAMCFGCKTDSDCGSLIDVKYRPACITCATCTETGGTMCAAFDGPP